MNAALRSSRAATSRRSIVVVTTALEWKLRQSGNKSSLAVKGHSTRLNRNDSTCWHVYFRSFHYSPKTATHRYRLLYPSPISFNWGAQASLSGEVRKRRTRRVSLFEKPNDRPRRFCAP